MRNLGCEFKSNGNRFGPITFSELKDADYGRGFRMPTMPELISLLYTSFERPYYEISKKVINTIKESYLTGDTGIFYCEEGVFFQDNPGMINERVSVNTERFVDRLSIINKGVVSNKDNTLRFVSHGFKTGELTSAELAKNSGIVGLVGSSENAEKLAKISEHFKLNPYFHLPREHNFSIRIAGLGVSYFGERLYINADESEKLARYSFGVIDLFTLWKISTGKIDLPERKNLVSESLVEAEIKKNDKPEKTKKSFWEWLLK